MSHHRHGPFVWFVIARKDWKPIRIGIQWLALIDNLVGVITFGFVLPEMSLNLMLWDLGKQADQFLKDRELDAELDAALGINNERSNDA